jgi:hypothetical protein
MRRHFDEIMLRQNYWLMKKLVVEWSGDEMNGW